MSEGRYNIPRQYKVEKGMPLKTLFEKVNNLKCRRVFESEIACVEWCYHLTDKNGITSVAELVREKGISFFEVNLKRKISPDLLLEVFAGLIRKPMVITFLCDGELSMGAFIPVGENGAGRMCTTDFYPYDAERMIELIDYETDSNKSAEEIHKRIFKMIRQQKRVIMIEKAFERISQEKEREMMSFEFSFENLDQIRADADFVQSQLRVV
ncbi:MAG: DUF4391 domain-containing protein [Lachnospiraceae bacterium]|nr:DUF4391 domain-containing protein [Lachnospiraceae bacterium]